MRCFMKLLTVVITILSVGMPIIASAESLCSKDEKMLFASKLEKTVKSVSLCQSKSDPQKIYYKFGTPQKIEITLPKEKSGKPSLSYDEEGKYSAQSITFPSGKIKYTLTYSSAEESVGLHVFGLKNPLYMSCEGGNQTNDLFLDAYDQMEKLGFKKK